MPKKQSEVIFVTILMIISMLVFMTYVGEFSKLIQYQSFRSFSFYSQYLELQEFLKNNRVSENLVTFVKKYSLYLWRSSRGMQVPLLLKKAPLSLRLRVMSAAYMDHINTHYVFEDCEQAFLRQLVGCLRLYHYNENMYVVNQSEITNCMHIVHTGQVQGKSDDTPPEMFHKGSFFGVLQGLVRDTPYTHSYQTMTKSEVLTLRLDDWEYLLAHFPDSKESIYKHMSDVTGSHMGSSNWPGGQDPEPPPEPRQRPSGRDIGKSNLPKLFPYDRRRMFDAGPSLFTQHSSSESIYSYPSRDFSRYNVTGTSRSAATRLTFHSSVDRDFLKNEPTISVLAPESKHTQQSHKVGKLEKVTRILKNLMGRYSDIDLKGLEMEDEEEASQTVLKQLDQARRLIGEIEKKNRHRYKKRLGSFLNEEDTEKFMFTSDILNEDQSLENNSGILLPRPLQIQDAESQNSLQEVDSMLPDASNITVGTELTPSVDIIPSTGVLPEWDTEEMQKIDTEINSPANETKEEHQDGPGWGSRVIQETDADIEIIPEIQLPTKSSGHLEDVNTQTTPEMTNTQVNTDEHIDPDEKKPVFIPGIDKTTWTNRPSQEIDADISALPKDQQKRRIEKDTDITINNQKNKRDADSLLESTDADIAPLPENIGSQIVKQDSPNLHTLSAITEEPSTSQEASTSPMRSKRKNVTLKYDEEKPATSSHDDQKDDDSTINEAPDISESNSQGSPTSNSKERKSNEPKK